jgi:drug/metabolite transporter (DMT)-like permease
MTGWAVAAAVTSAACFALAAALQQVEADHTPTSRRGGVSLLWHLCHRPRWVVGIAAMAAGAALHTLALSIGPLPLVQPIGVIGLLFALPLGARLHGRRMRVWDWWAAIAVVVGLTVFLRLARTPAHPPHLSTVATLVLVAVTAASVAGCVLWARYRGGPSRAVALAAGAGIAFGASSALVRAVGAHTVTRGAAALLSWPTLALAVVAPVGFVLCQHAYRVGSLGAALSTMTVLDPLTAIAFAAALLGEGIHTGASGAASAAGAGALIIAGIVVLAGRTTRTPAPMPVRSAAPLRVHPAGRVTDRPLTRIR